MPDPIRTKFHGSRINYAYRDYNHPPLQRKAMASVYTHSGRTRGTPSSCPPQQSKVHLILYFLKQGGSWLGRNFSKTIFSARTHSQQKVKHVQKLGEESKYIYSLSSLSSSREGRKALRKFSRHSLSDRITHAVHYTSVIYLIQTSIEIKCYLATTAANHSLTFAKVYWI